jgi:hypothetical protein
LDFEIIIQDGTGWGYGSEFETVVRRRSRAWNDFDMERSFHSAGTLVSQWVAAVQRCVGGPLRDLFDCGIK